MGRPGTVLNCGYDVRPIAITFVVRLLALSFDWGVVGVWAALDVLIAARLALLGPRFARRRWAVVGWE